MAYNQFPEHPDDSVGGWMLTLFLMGLPLVGFVYLLVLALGSGGSPAKRNFARAALIWQIICGLVAVFSSFSSAQRLWRRSRTRVCNVEAHGKRPCGGGIRITRLPPPHCLGTHATL